MKKMNLKNTFYKHKENGTSLTILIIIVVLFSGLKIYDSIPNFQNINFVNLTFNILNMILFATLIILIEKKGSSFTSHFILLAFYLGNYIYLLFNGSSTNNPVNTLTVVLGVIASVYAGLKMFAHQDEIKKYVPAASRTILVLIIFSLIDVYMNSGFDKLLVFILLYISILTTLKVKETLLMVIMIFSMQLFGDLNLLIISFRIIDPLDLIRLIISILFTLFFIYYAYKTYITDTISYDDNSTSYYYS